MSTSVQVLTIIRTLSYDYFLSLVFQQYTILDRLIFLMPSKHSIRYYELNLNVAVLRTDRCNQPYIFPQKMFKQEIY